MRTLDSPRRGFVSAAARTVHELSCARLPVVVAVPHARLRDALATALESTGTIAVVAQAGDVGAAIRLARCARPCALLLGTSMLDGDVARALRTVVRALDGVPVVATGHDRTPAYEAAIIAAGAAAYAPLHGDADGLARLLRYAANSKSRSSPA
jgi:DNA-binding NarL/FixJ family response regulator